MKYKPQMKSGSLLLVINEVQFKMQLRFCLWNLFLVYGIYLRLKIMKIPDG